MMTRGFSLASAWLLATLMVAIRPTDNSNILFAAANHATIDTDKDFEGKFEDQLVMLSDSPTDLEFSPDGKYLFVTQKEGRVFYTTVDELDSGDDVKPKLVFDVNDPEADLEAEVLFGTAPAFDLAELDGVPVTRLVHVFTDEDIDADLQRRLDLAAELVDEAPETALTEDHVAIVDIQPVDAGGEATGPVQHDAQIVLANPELRAELRDALVGQTAGGEVVVEFVQPADEEDEAADGETAESRVDRYRVTVKTVQRRDVPEMDDAWVQAHTDGKVETVDGLREEARRELESSWERRAAQSLESKMVEAFVEAHDFPVPQVLTEAMLDAMVDEVREQMPDKALPDTFDQVAFRDGRRAQAEAQVRWYLVKDKLVTDEGLEVSNEDFEEEFARIAGEGGDVETIKGFFQQQPQMLQQMGDHLLNQRVFASLESRFDVVEKSREDLERERAERDAE